MLATDQPAAQRSDRDYPQISILIAARNEEATILDCLQAITQLDYPSDAVEVLIGDDQSTDRTGSFVADFIADKPNFQLVSITYTQAGLRGKPTYWRS